MKKTYERVPSTSALLIQRGHSLNNGGNTRGTLVGNYMTTNTYEDLKVKKAQDQLYNPMELHQRNGNTNGKPQSLTRQNSHKPARLASANAYRSNNYHTQTMQELKPIKRNDSSFTYTGGLGITAITPSTNDTN